MRSAIASRPCANPSVARLINAKPSDIALLENATRAWHNVFYAFDFVPGDRIVVGRSEYSSNYLACLQVARTTGAEIVVIDDDEAGQIDVDALRRTIDDRVPKLISLAHVPTGGGLINPAAEVGRVARDAGIPFLSDATQSVGQLVIDVEEIGCHLPVRHRGESSCADREGRDFSTCECSGSEGSTRRWLDTRAATWVSRDVYELRDDARRFETWEVSYALQLGLGRAVDYALALGLGEIEAREVSLPRTPPATLSDIRRVPSSTSVLRQSPSHTPPSPNGRRRRRPPIAPGLRGPPTSRAGGFPPRLRAPRTSRSRARLGPLLQHRRRDRSLRQARSPRSHRSGGLHRGDLDEVAASVVEDGGRQRARLRRRLSELHAQSH